MIEIIIGVFVGGMIGTTIMALLSFRKKNFYCISDKEFNRKVTSETVEQYTGLTDKNGKKIFEGDVIRVKCSLRLPAGFGNSIRIVTHGIDFIATVIFDKCRFCLEKANGEVCEMPLDSEAVEVVGNIYDNPELLEVTK